MVYNLRQKSGPGIPADYEDQTETKLARTKEGLLAEGDDKCGDPRKEDHTHDHPRWKIREQATKPQLAHRAHREAQTYNIQTA